MKCFVHRWIKKDNNTRVKTNTFISGCICRSFVGEFQVSWLLNGLSNPTPGDVWETRLCSSHPEHSPVSAPPLLQRSSGKFPGSLQLLVPASNLHKRQCRHQTQPLSLSAYWCCLASVTCPAVSSAVTQSRLWPPAGATQVHTWTGARMHSYGCW